jgi:superfamily II DNA helicase RecQ
MQIKLFTIPVGDSGGALQEMNVFLRSNKILEIQDRFVSNEHGAYWCFCVRYLERAFPGEGERKPGAKVDYRKELDEATFQKFSKLREIRKQAAAAEGVSTFMVCTDEELAEMAKLDAITAPAMLGIKGIGDKKVERYGKYFITPTAADEKGGQTD